VTFVLVVVVLAGGFALGRLYRWLKGELLSTPFNDPSLVAHRAASDIAAQTRRAEEQIHRLDQWRPNRQ
jgi:hypothetical protein